MNVTPESSTVVAGRKPVLAALASTDVNIECVYLRRDMKNSIAAEIRKICGEQGIPVKFVPQEKLNRLTEGTLHQGVVAVTTAIELLDLESMLADIAPSWDDTMRLKPLLLIPDRISDPHNLGAIVRSAAAFGCSGVILPERNSAPLGSTTIKASAGAALSMRFARVGNVGQAIRQLKERGYWVAGLAGTGSVSLDEADWDRPIVLVVGNEADGISKGVESECDLLVSIPISPSVESLNASVAAGIALHAAARARFIAGTGESD
ncbi:MAG TPA: 23S rRNA (guanosine(2251)-2'-O)-methyltransferase RlmB [Rhodothermia bacterium]|nr:23S rRNA (guanosine(2251)-2'-O)-methyltransferase RlmB [Rhodothermia bacterium]